MLDGFTCSEKPEDGKEIKVILKQKNTDFIDFSKFRRNKLRQAMHITSILSQPERCSKRKSITSYIDSEHIHEEKNSKINS